MRRPALNYHISALALQFGLRGRQVIERYSYVEMMRGVLHDAMEYEIQRPGRNHVDCYQHLRLRRTPLALVVEPRDVGVRMLGQQGPTHEPDPNSEGPNH